MSDPALRRLRRQERAVHYRPVGSKGRWRKAVCGYFYRGRCEFGDFNIRTDLDGVTCRSCLAIMCAKKEG